MTPPIVIALGGNALLKRGEAPDIATQRRNAGEAARALAPIAARHDIVITHGNGPQIGLLAQQQATQPAERIWPLDVLGAESEGLIGYLLEQELRRVLPHRKLATLLTMVEVDPADPAMARPTKPIGPVYEKPQWDALARRFGWAGAPDGGFMRRVVPSPRPKSILQTDVIRDLLAAGAIPICAGGGGVPVARGGGGWTGVEAVIDKDWTSARLAAELGADRLVMLTDVEAIYRDWNTPDAAPIGNLTPSEAAAMALPAGSMGPKAAAAAWFAATTGRPAMIGALARAPEVVAGTSGTRIG